MFDRKLVVAYALVTLSPYPFLDGEKDGKLDWDIWDDRDIKAREGGTERERADVRNSHSFPARNNANISP